MSQRDRDHDGAPPVEDVDAEDVQLHVADPDDYNETRRLRAIYDARSKAREKLQQVQDVEYQDEHDRALSTLGMTLSTYYAELEPLLEATGADTTLNDGPWADLEEYTALGGLRDQDGRGHLAPRQYHLYVYRKLNRLLEELKPLVTEDSTDTWEV